MVRTSTNAYIYDAICSDRMLAEPKDLNKIRTMVTKWLWQEHFSSLVSVNKDIDSSETLVLQRYAKAGLHYSNFCDN